MNFEEREIFPRIAFRKLQASFQRPQINEGFVEVVDVDFEVSILIQIKLSFLAKDLLM